MKHAMKTFLALLLVLITVVCLFAGCAAKSEDAVPAEDASAPVEGAKDEAPAKDAKPTFDKLICGTSADYAPFEFMYADTKGEMQYAGIDVSTAKYICDYIGAEIQIENMSFDFLLTSLAKGDFDFVIAAMEDTEERQNAADFSDPYYTDMPTMIVTKKANADQYQTLADFAGKNVGAQNATTKADIVTNDIPEANLVSLALVTDLVNELVYDKVDAVVLDGAVAMAYVGENPDLVICPASDELGTVAYYSVAVAKGDPKGLLPLINAAIAKMTEENCIETFIADADALSGVAVEVSADAPAE